MFLTYLLHESTYTFGILKPAIVMAKGYDIQLFHSRKAHLIFSGLFRILWQIYI